MIGPSPCTKGSASTARGVLREALYRDGVRYDMYLYGLLRREWEAQQTPALTHCSK